MRRRNAFSLPAGQNSATASSNAAAMATEMLQSEEIIMDDAAATTHVSSRRQDHSLGQGSEPGTKLPPKSRQKSKEKGAGNGKDKTTGNIMFPNLVRPGPVERADAEDMGRYVMDAPPLPDLDNKPESSSAKNKGKGRAPEPPTSITPRKVKIPSAPNQNPPSSTYAGKRIEASVARRVANYAITHPPGWFDGLPSINEELFVDKPHKEYHMVKIHTAKCGVCRQYNRGTLFMCAACTITICEPCADGKCGVSGTGNATGDGPKENGDVMMTGVSEGEERRGEDVNVATSGGSDGEERRGGDVNVVIVSGVSDGEERHGKGADVVIVSGVSDGEERHGKGADACKLGWSNPYHEVFRDAYLEWKMLEEDRKNDRFESTEGVVFKGSTAKIGGRKRKATST